MISNLSSLIQSNNQLTRIVIASAIPTCFLLLLFFIRSHAGPFWHWYLMDPSYFYLLDGINLLNGNTPGHIYHPGVTVHTLNASLLWVYNLFTTGSFQDLILVEPEKYLRLTSNVVMGLSALAIFLVGIIGRISFGSWPPTLACQLAPFTSTIILKHAFQPKPESLLIFATCLLIGLKLCGRGENPIISGPTRLSVAFGIVGGFILATKITAAPILILPLFLLSGVVPRLIFMVVSAAAFFLFFLPAIGAIDQFLDWILRLGSNLGSHGSGPSGVINFEHYMEAFLKILKRPSMKIPLILAAFTICVAGWKMHRNQHHFDNNDIRGLLGVSAAQLAQVTLVAKQAAAFYMIPAYMLASVSVLLSLRILWSARPANLLYLLPGRYVGIAMLLFFFAAQVMNSSKLADHFGALRAHAEILDYKSHPTCARIYNYAASSPVFAMYLSNFTTGERLSVPLKARFPKNQYWINDWWSWKPAELRNWDGKVSLREIRETYPCLVFHGSKRNGVEHFLDTQTPKIEFKDICSSGPEFIRTIATTCNPR